MNYSSRRTTHLLKLSMIAAMDHSDAEVIEATTFNARKTG
jgi:hypothetical protein